MAGTTGTHDVGGLDDEVGPIDVDSGSRKYKLWELQTHCLLTLLSKKGLITVDEVGVSCYSSFLLLCVTQYLLLPSSWHL